MGTLHPVHVPVTSLTHAVLDARRRCFDRWAERGALVCVRQHEREQPLFEQDRLWHDPRRHPKKVAWRAARKRRSAWPRWPAHVPRGVVEEDCSWLPKCACP